MSSAFFFCHYSCWYIELGLVQHNLFPSNDLADSTKLHIYLKGGGGCHSFEDGSEKNCVRRWFCNNGCKSISFSPLNIGRAFKENTLSVDVVKTSTVLCARRAQRRPSSWTQTPCGALTPLRIQPSMTLQGLEITFSFKSQLKVYQVYVPYCSSDLYVGTRNPSDDIRGYNFHGKYIVKVIAV